MPAEYIASMLEISEDEATAILTKAQQLTAAK
jgi:hypothetical protein